MIDCVIFSDKFDRADKSYSISTAEDGWIPLSGVWSIDTNRLSESGNANAQIRTVEEAEHDGAVAQVRVKAVQVSDKVRLWAHGTWVQYEQLNATTGEIYLSCGANMQLTINAGDDVVIWLELNGEVDGTLFGGEMLWTPWSEYESCYGEWCEAGPTTARYAMLENVAGTAVWFDDFVYSNHPRYNPGQPSDLGIAPVRWCECISCISCEWSAMPKTLTVTIEADGGCANYDGTTCTFSYTDQDCLFPWESPGCLQYGLPDKLVFLCNWGDCTQDCVDFILGSSSTPICAHGWTYDPDRETEVHPAPVSCTCDPFSITYPWIDVPAPANYFCPNMCSGASAGRYRILITE